jgi:hypothetical protein
MMTDLRFQADRFKTSDDTYLVEKQEKIAPFRLSTTQIHAISDDCFFIPWRLSVHRIVRILTTLPRSSQIFPDLLSHLSLSWKFGERQANLESTARYFAKVCEGDH